MKVCIHTNLGLGNQFECARWLEDGFARHGIKAEITPDKHKAADVHVVQGPWYCLDYWRPLSDERPVLWLNRCFYGDARFDLSIGWLRPDGSRDFRNDGAAGAKGSLPQLKPRKANGRCAVVFADYGRDMAAEVRELREQWNGSLYFRPHPAQPDVSVKAITLSGPLADVWALCDTAIGHSTTALIEARLNGLQIQCSDPLNAVTAHPGDDERWLRELSWAQWSAHEHNPEIQRGDFWEHLQ